MARRRCHSIENPTCDIKTVRAGVLEVAYLEFGEANGWAVILSHGFPFDVHAYEQVAAQLAGHGARVIVPFLRGFGPTRFFVRGDDAQRATGGIGVRSPRIAGCAQDRNSDSGLS
jgi:pimeloyl-ACP methyl ester carboxylesterase